MKTNIDPVCGMTVDDTSLHRLEHQGRHYLFCSQHCLDKFKASPTSFDGTSPAPVAQNVGAAYTCPMHPEVRQPCAGQLSQVRHGAGAGNAC